LRMRTGKRRASSSSGTAGEQCVHLPPPLLPCRCRRCCQGPHVHRVAHAAQVPARGQGASEHRPPRGRSMGQHVGAGGGQQRAGAGHAVRRLCSCLFSHAHACMSQCERAVEHCAVFRMNYTFGGAYKKSVAAHRAARCLPRQRRRQLQRCAQHRGASTPPLGV
jgi:hypothetical protein